ncbi:hypothetical protein B0T14DRAFT_519689 [Immersiella caudata]|uniref:Uncharacterized protein n=1 Tax=Immersiella caudata TaxID=314043 RepID=A0AA39WQG3_9PEZI|nr:hypothetical protein B0T14DRAFT_519689 [Immersiella caudata]
MAFFRSVLAQMIFCGFVALLGPGLRNANSLGAGGALLPYLVNGGDSLVFGQWVSSASSLPSLSALEDG